MPKEPKAIINQYQFPASVSSIHSTYLGNGLMTLIDDQKKIFGKIIKQTKWPGVRASVGQRTGSSFQLPLQ